MIVVAFAGACGSAPAVDDGGSTESSTTQLGIETGEDACPELIWSDPGGNLELGALEITSMQQANALPPYTRIDGTLRVSAVEGIADLSFLACLSEVRGGLAIFDNPDLETLQGLERLSTLDSPLVENANLFIVRNPNLRNLDGLSGLEALPRLYIEENPLLETIDGLRNLRTADTISIQRNAILPTISLPALETVGVLEVGNHQCPRWDPAVDPAPAPDVDGNPGLVDLDGLENLQTYDDLWLKGNPSLVSIDGILGASGGYNRVELNEALPYTAVVQLGSVVSCGNLDEPEPCECQLSAPD